MGNRTQLPGSRVLQWRLRLAKSALRRSKTLVDVWGLLALAQEPVKEQGWLLSVSVRAADLKSKRDQHTRSQRLVCVEVAG